MLRARAVVPVTGILAAVGYPLLAAVALTRYPHVYSPTANWLSDLGDPALNPAGANCYEVGVIASGLLLVPFFLSFSCWLVAANSTQRILVRLTQASGILGAVALILCGLVPETAPAPHIAISAILFILVGTTLVLSILALRYVDACPRWLLMLGAVAASADLVYGAFHSVQLLEWAATALFLCYMCLLSLVMVVMQISPESTPLPVTSRVSPRWYQTAPPTPSPSQERPNTPSFP